MDHDFKLQKPTVKTCLALFLLVLLLTYFFLFCPFIEYSQMFSSFQLDSENLVSEFINTEGGYSSSNYLGYVHYSSNFGLQGHVYRFLSNLHHGFFFYHLVTALALAFTVVLISWFLLGVDPLLSFVFYLVMGLSPWVLSMARNLYWVQFTWYLPILVGLEYYFDIFNGRHWLYYGQMTFFVMIKSLCGYEFVTCVLISAMAFPLLKLIKSIKEKRSPLNEFRIVFTLGAFAVLGLVFAMVIHAWARSPGNIADGFKSMFNNTLFRMSWAQKEYIQERFSNNLEVADWLSYTVDVSLWDAVKTYFSFPTDLVYGISGSMFTFLGMSSVIISSGYLLFKKDSSKLILLIVTLASSISWIILAKPHVMGHTHICYIIWYMGYVQIILYIPIRLLFDLLRLFVSKLKGNNRSNGRVENSI